MNSEDVIPAAESENGGLGWAVVAIACVAMLVCIALVFAALGAWGVSRRVPRAGSTPQVIMVATGIDGVEQLAALGTHGALVVQAGAKDSYSAISLEGAVPTRTGQSGHVFPPPAIDAAAAYRSAIASDNYMWVATRLGLVRNAIQLVPPAQFDQLLAAVAAARTPLTKVTSDSVTLQYAGDIHTVYRRLPRLGTDAVLFVNASYFLDSTPEQLVSQLHDAGVRPRLLVASYDEDDPQVTQAARQRLLDFVNLAPRGL